VVVRRGGLVAEEHAVDGPIVATLVPGVRGVDTTGVAAKVVPLDLELPEGAHDSEVLEVLPPDPATVDLSEAARIVSGGAGLGGPGPFVVLRQWRSPRRVVRSQRVAADVGWVPQDRFIGTTGVMVDPSLYIGARHLGCRATRHRSGQSDHIVAVNTDASAPMMAMADLAIVTDARALLDELADRLGVHDELSRTRSGWGSAADERTRRHELRRRRRRAGPAGSAAALVLARAGVNVALVEPRPFPGSKNMYGGVVYGRILDTLIPRWWEEVPVERWITRRGTNDHDGDAEHHARLPHHRVGEAPYNGCTTLRPEFDAWLAAKAEDAGATCCARRR